ncbi:hypothetical protein ColLi_13397 [Colletotrichum liriopes]|uniref:Uncharacterized protein n=1 Tax=Colletotrichum liriopes TaxID=708192 RepID=A0AA37H112_9PEZI|nr:hypothetical protein ColLi_13397 [Colletotrichum liriopes]
MPPKGDEPDHHKNQIDPNPKKRQSHLKAITNRGLQRAGENLIKSTLFGHDYVLKNLVAQAGRFIRTT